MVLGQSKSEVQRSGEHHIFFSFKVQKSEQTSSEILNPSSQSRCQLYSSMTNLTETNKNKTSFSFKQASKPAQDSTTYIKSKEKCKHGKCA